MKCDLVEVVRDAIGWSTARNALEFGRSDEYNCAGTPGPAVVQSAPVNPNAVFWAYAYDSYWYLAQSTRHSILKWMAPRWEAVVGAPGNPRPYNPGARRFGYVNHAYVYAYQVYVWVKYVVTCTAYDPSSIRWESSPCAPSLRAICR